MAENDFANPVIDGGGFGDMDWQTAAAEQERRRRDEEMTARMNENRADLAQYDEMLGAQRAQAAQRRANGLRQTAIAMRYAMQNGGKVPEQLIPAFNQKMGYDGKTRRFLGGMYDGKGNLHFFMQNGDGQGNFQDAPVTLDRKGQFDLMREFPGIFSDEDVNAMAQSLMTKDGLTRDQIWGGNATPGSRTATGGTVVNPSWLTGPQRRSSISAFGADGRGGFTNYESSEQTGYQLQQRDSGTRAPQPELSERERIAQMREAGLNEREKMKERGRHDRAVMSEEGRLARGEGSGRGGLTFEQRMQLEEQKNKRLETQEQGRSARAKQGEDLSKARLVATVSRNWYDLKNSLGLSDEQAEGLQDWMAKSFTQAFDPSQGGRSENPSSEAKSVDGSAAKKGSPDAPGASAAAKDGKSAPPPKKPTVSQDGKTINTPDGQTIQMNGVWKYGKQEWRWDGPGPKDWTRLK